MFFPLFTPGSWKMKRRRKKENKKNSPKDQKPKKLSFTAALLLLFLKKENALFIIIDKRHFLGSSSSNLHAPHPPALQRPASSDTVSVPFFFMASLYRFTTDYYLSCRPWWGLILDFEAANVELKF